jgi:hypothetical protein
MAKVLVLVRKNLGGGGDFRWLHEITGRMPDEIHISDMVKNVLGDARCWS